MVGIPIYIEKYIIVCWFMLPLSDLTFCTPTKSNLQIVIHMIVFSKLDL